MDDVTRACAAVAAELRLSAEEIVARSKAVARQAEKLREQSNRLRLKAVASRRRSFTEIKAALPPE